MCIDGNHRGATMIRMTIFASALALALTGTAQAGTIKRDIHGFEIGMSFAAAKTNAAKQGCELARQLDELDGLDDEIKAPAKRYACIKDDKAQFDLIVGAYSGKLLAVQTPIKSTFRLHRVALDICGQYAQSCADNIKHRRKKAATIAVDETEGLYINVTSSRGANTYMVSLSSQKLKEEEDKLVPGAVMVPKL